MDKKNKRYAILDWDNTIRNGYTLYSWVEYLYQCKIIDTCLLRKLEVLKYQYIKKEITHDQYAYRACVEYAKTLAGKEIRELDQVMDKYIIEDRKFLFPQMCILLKRMAQKNIDIIIISGAPFRILEQYKKKLYLKEIYAFREGETDGVFTGKVACNYGFDKNKKVKELIKQYGGHPYIACGDSQSDISLLDNSDYPICIGNELKQKSYININFNDSIEDILNVLECIGL